MPDIQRTNPQRFAPLPGGRLFARHPLGQSRMGRRADGALVGAGDATAQARQVYANLRTAMESVGGRSSTS